MKKCLKILFPADIPDDFLQKVVQKAARELEVEGTAQILGSENTVKIIACGPMELVEELLDTIHKETAKVGIDTIEIEPFIKEKDYRGVFRIIE